MRGKPKFSHGLAGALLLGTTLCAPAWAQDVSDWRGIYMGVGVGGAYSAAQPDTRVLINGYFTDPLPTSDTAQVNPILQRVIDGWDVTGSAIVGYNFQRGHFVYGVEADLTLMNFQESRSAGPIVYDTSPTNTFRTKTTVNSNYTVSLRPSVGYVTGKFLLAVSAGPAVSTFKTTFDYNDTFGGGNSLRYEDTSTRLGFSASAGVGYQISDGWSVRGDYVLNYFPNIASGNPNLAGDGRSDFDIGSDFQSHNLRLAILKSF